MEDLAEMVDDNGECVVENFTVGRKGNITTGFYALKLSVTNPFVMSHPGVHVSADGTELSLLCSDRP